MVFPESTRKGDPKKLATNRLAAIPFEHLEAELAAFPIASEAGFRSAVVELDPVTPRRKEPKGEELSRSAEREILASVPSVPLDEFVAIRDRLWFGSDPWPDSDAQPVPLVLYLRRLADDYLDDQGRPVDLPSENNGRQSPSPRARARWSWLCRALPSDLVRVARNIGPADDSPFSLSPAVDRLLGEKGYAETHLHLGAAADFSLLWANLMHALAVEEVSESSFASPGACFSEGRHFGKWLLWAAVMRLVLAEWLFAPDGVHGHYTMRAFMNLRWRGGRVDPVITGNVLRLMLELQSGRPGARPLRFAQARTVYRSLIRPSPFLWNRAEERRRLQARRRPENREEVFNNDPVARVVGWHGATGSNPETHFVGKALRYMERCPDDADFARIFWQVIRVRCLLYRHLVQRPLTPGLQWFVRFYSRIKPVRRQLPVDISVQAAIGRTADGRGLRSLEVRVGTEGNQSDCLDRIKRANEAPAAAAVECGVVFHFSRNRGGGWREGRPHAHGLDWSYPAVRHEQRLGTSPDVGNPSGFRFARFYLQQRREAQALVGVLRGFPLALRTFRGIDLCTDEAGVPIWVMAPLMRWVREAGQVAAALLRDRGIESVPPLRTTVHAGEDFVHLLTGLRRLDEAIRHLGLEEGDRIGHGMALGLDPTTWFGRIGRVVQTREERLLDLVWEWNFYAKSHADVGSGRLSYLRSNIARLGEQVFGGTVTPEDLVHLIRALHCERELKGQGFPAGSGRATAGIQYGQEQKEPWRRLLRGYLGSSQVWRNGRIQETITFRDLPHELEALHSLQGALRSEVGTRGLTVEVNPSSNLLIGDLGQLEDHPIWRLRPLQPVDDIPRLSVCVGSDDPLTFATTLPHEYQLLFDTIVMAGRSHEEAMGWLNDVREAGLRARFTLPRCSTKKLRPVLVQGRRPLPPP